MGVGFFESEILGSQVFWMLIFEGGSSGFQGQDLFGFSVIIFPGPRFLGFLKALKVFDFLNLWFIILQLFGFSFFFSGRLVLIIRFFGFMFRFLLLIVGL